METPRICIASTKDPNRRGWVDASQDESKFVADVVSILSEPIPDGWGWEIDDTEGFYSLRVDRWDTSDIVKVARGIAEHGEAFAAWVGYLGSPEYVEDGYDDFTDVYAGCWESVEAYVKGQYYDVFGGDDNIVKDEYKWMSRYVSIDWDQWVYDTESEYVCIEGNKGVHIFYP